MVFEDIIKPQHFQLLNTARTRNNYRLEELKSSTDGLQFDEFLYTSKENNNFSTTSYESFFDDHFKTPNLKKVKNSFTFLAKALHTADTATKLKWTRQLIFKLNLIHSVPKSNHDTIDIECLKIDAEKYLVLDINSRVKKSFIKQSYIHPIYYFGHKLNYKKQYIWSAGICIYYINTSNFPWKKASLNDKDFRIWIKEGRFKDTIDEPLMALLKDMLNVDQRLSIKVILKKLLKMKPNQKAMSEF